MCQHKIDEIVHFVSKHTHIEYCICGSGLKFIDCCKHPLDENLHWYLNPGLYDYTIQALKILELKDGDEEVKYSKKFICGLYKQLQGLGLFNKCICPGCVEKPIGSHLFPNAFLMNVQKEGYIFTMSGVEKGKGIGADNFKMNLLCEHTDRELFNATDTIGDMMSVFDLFLSDESGIEQQDDRHKLIGEFGAKTFFFKFKTDILEHMRYFYHGLIITDFDNKEGKESYLRSFVKSYKKYQRIITYFYKNFFRQDLDGKRMIKIPYMDGRSRKVMNKEGGATPFPQDEMLYFSNIKFIRDIPIYIVSMQKDGERVYFIGVAAEDKIANEREGIVLEVYKKIAEFKEAGNFKGAYEWIMDFSFNDNPIFYITPKVGYIGTTYIHGRKNN